MNDTTRTLADLKVAVKQLVDERDWNQFHSLKNLAMKISTEANELMEHFVWDKGQETFEKLPAKKQQAVQDEFADIMILLCAFANACDMDIARAFEHKLAEVKVKYPIEKAKGSPLKYTEL
jgi:NTP pyrophosphatase (non-canonical NTP hydrolase)